MLAIGRNFIRPAVRRALINIQPMRLQSCDPKTPNPKFDKIRKLQKHFQKDDGKPIFLKGGPMDNLLYRATWALAFLGLALDVKLFLYYLLK